MWGEFGLHGFAPACTVRAEIRVFPDVAVASAPVAQLDRALPSEGRGQRFESSRVRHFLQVLSSPSISFTNTLLARSSAKKESIALVASPK